MVTKSKKKPLIKSLYSNKFKNRIVKSKKIKIIFKKIKKIKD